MSYDEAVAEARRWLAHCERQEAKSERISGIARSVQAGSITAAAGQAMVRDVDNSIVIYDGSKLQEAVRILIGEATPSGVKGKP
jgi:predicted HAD superfamily phosphohydrolase YqeG